MYTEELCNACRKLIRQSSAGSRELKRFLTEKKKSKQLQNTVDAGLRVSEIVSLEKDIDSSRMQIFIKRAKGKKDRYVNLSRLLLDIVRKYILEYKPRPKVYLFESEQTLVAYPTRTASKYFQMPKGEGGIKKEVGIHSLRHSLWKKEGLNGKDFFIN